MNLSYYKHCTLALLLGGATLLQSCDKTLTVNDEPTIEVSVEKASYKVGEEVTFNLTGLADIVSFYSGEITNDYNFREGRILDLAEYGASLSFSSSTINGAQDNQIAILASSDFNGNYSDINSVRQAKWTDITSRFVLGNSATFVGSTSIDISDIMMKGKPIYIAIKYITKPQLQEGLSRTWMFQDFQLVSNAVIGGSKPVISNQTNLAFQIVDPYKELAPARSLVTGTRLTLLGNEYKDPNDPIYNPENPIYDPENPIYDPQSPTYDPNAQRPEFKPYDPNDPSNDPQTEHWTISKGIVGDKLDLGPDWSIPVKSIRSVTPSTFKHTYAMPGTYKVLFVATNSSIDESKTIHKELTLTITE